MRKRWIKWVFLFSVVLCCFLMFSTLMLAKDAEQVWEVLDPGGVIKIEPMKVNLHPSNLEGKTVVLRWNGKHNGDKFLERVGELLKERVKEIKLIKSWEVAPETVDPITGNQERSLEFAKAIAKYKPDLVIGAQSD